MWIAKMTRSWIVTDVREVAKQSHNPAPRHWKAALRLFENLSATRSQGVRHSKKGEDELIANADAAYASCKEDRQSISGETIEVPRGTVSWFSRSPRAISLN